LGIRCHTRQEYDPENPARPTQFGMMPGEAVAALRRLIRAGVRLETVHFHLRTNVASPGSYARALAEVAAICRQARFQPKYLDCGGGWPPSRVRGKTGRLLDADFDLAQMRRVYASVASAFPGLGELWLENGRFVTARSGVLVVRVLAVKERRRRRFLICDGGRTMNALVSNWEVHDLFPVPPRTGPLVPTTVCGPTCMAFDQLARCRLPVNVRVGDCLVWTEAGAYHLPWETRFSHGYAAVVWHEANRLTVVRPRESFEGWWGMWNAPS
jgi:diaminopimelate decarboxylase